jgi:hypothetical protein
MLRVLSLQLSLFRQYRSGYLPCRKKYQMVYNCISLVVLAMDGPLPVNSQIHPAAPPPPNASSNDSLASMPSLRYRAICQEA